MRWSDLAFLHWPVPAGPLQALLPADLQLDTFDGQAWIGVVPFRMEGVRHRWSPPVPGADTFPELNLRTYVRGGDRAGVWFFSLDAASRLAVRGARLGLNMPYFDAAMQLRRTGNVVDCVSRRTHRRAPDAEFSASYEPTGVPFLTQPGSLEHWLTERYCFFGTTRYGGLYAVDVHHLPWPLQPARVTVRINTVADAFAIQLPSREPLAHFAATIDVVAWPPARLAAGR
jgi:uncharacterized protein